MKHHTEVKLRDGTRLQIGRSKKALREGFDRFKSAAIGGEQEQQFEQSFASLAWAYVSDKAPALLDYLVGFQLVDRNDDNTKAAGIFGFKIGDSWVYAPVFFINGDLRGHELLYLKNQDAFVPMKENWVNYIINKRPHILGEGAPGTNQEMGITEPDIQSLSRQPAGTKFSSMRRPRFKKFAQASGLPKFLGTVTTRSPREKDAELHDRLDLRKFLSEAPILVKLALDIRDQYPIVGQAMDHFYGPNLLRDCLLEMKAAFQKSASVFQERKTAGAAVVKTRATSGGIFSSRVKIAAEEEPPKKLEVMTDQLITENLPSDMSDGERETLLNQGYLVRDYRQGDEVAKAYNTQILMELRNPDSTGVYDVLTSEGEFKRCLVVYGPQAEKGRKTGMVTLVRLDGGDRKAVENYHPTQVFVKDVPPEPNSDRTAWLDWYDELSEDTSLQEDGKYIVVTQGGSGTCAFTVEQEMEGDNYEVYWDDYVPYSRRDLPVDAVAPQCEGVGSECRVVCLGMRRGTGLKSHNGKLYLPEESRIIRLEAPPRCRKCDKLKSDCTCDYFSPKRPARPPVLSPGDLAAVQLQLVQKAASYLDGSSARDGGSAGGSALYQIKVWADGNDIIVGRERFSKLGALVSLVKGHQLREKQAKEIIQRAERGLDEKYWIVKAAQPVPGALGPYETMQGPSAPVQDPAAYSTDPAYGGVPAMYADGGQSQPVSDMSAGNTDPSIYDPMQNIDPNAMQTAQQAYQNNQKEIFDTTMVQSMLNAVRQDSIVDRYLGDLTKALDRWGRILFMFYWHNEDFSERYGKQDLPELEDTLRNVFESTGDAVLYLKQKTVEPATFGEPTLDEAATA